MSIKTIELQEYIPNVLPAEALPQHVAKLLWSQYGEKIQIEPPTFKTDNHWRITPQGWAGHIPVDEGFHFFIKPKVELGNLSVVQGREHVERFLSIVRMDPSVDKFRLGIVLLIINAGQPVRICACEQLICCYVPFPNTLARALQC